MDRVTQVILALGHENILAIHPTTLMLTKDRHVSKNGDCVVAVAADKAAADLNQQFKDAIIKPNAKVTIDIEANDVSVRICASGSLDLLLTHPSDLVVRKSGFVSDRTLAIYADKASNDLPRSFVQMLQNPKQQIKITLNVEF